MIKPLTEWITCEIKKDNLTEGGIYLSTATEKVIVIDMGKQAEDKLGNIRGKEVISCNVPPAIKLEADGKDLILHMEAIIGYKE